MPDLSSSETLGDHPVLLFFCGARERQIEAEIAREFESDAAVFSGVCRGEKQLCSLFCIFSPSFSSTREFAPVWEKTSRNIVRSRPRAALRPRPFASAAVLTFS